MRWRRKCVSCGSLLRLLWKQISERRPGTSKRPQPLRVVDQDVDLVAPGIQPWPDRGTRAVSRQRGRGAVARQRQQCVAVARHLPLEPFPSCDVGADAGGLLATQILPRRQRGLVFGLARGNAAVLPVASEQRQLDPEFQHEPVAAAAVELAVGGRTAESRVGKGGVSRGNSRWEPYN